MNNDMDEPEWLGLSSSLISAAVLLVVFGAVVPLAIFLGIELLDIQFITSKSLWITFPIFCIVPSMMILKALDSRFPVTWSIEAGCVQFIKNGLPGDETVYKLDGGFHVLLPFYIKWRSQWSYDEKWEVQIMQYSVSLSGTSDVIVKGEATVVPLKDNLLPLHLIGKDTHDSTISTCTQMRQDFVVRNMLARLQNIIETSVSKLKEECDENTKRKDIDSVLDVIQNSDKAWDKINDEIERTASEVARKFGVKIDSFTLGDIDHPEPVKVQRNSTASYKILADSAIQLVKQSEENGITGEFKLADAMLGAQIQAGKVPKTVAVTRKGYESETLKASSDVIAAVTEIAKMYFESQKKEEK